MNTLEALLEAETRKNQTERHKVVRLIGKSLVGGIPDLAASKFLTEAGFIAEKGDPNLAFRGARPPADDFFVDLAIKPGKRHEGSFKLIKVQPGGETVVESGQLSEVDKAGTHLIITGQGQTLASTQIVIDLEPVKKNGQAVAPPAPPAPPLPPAPPPALPKPPRKKSRPLRGMDIRAVKRTVAMIGHNAQLMLGKLDALKANQYLWDSEARAALAVQAQKAAQTLEEFSKQLSNQLPATAT